MVTNSISGVRQLALRGYARVHLDDLSFAHSSHRDLDERNISRLSKVFHIEGCQRTDEHNFIDVVVKQTDLDLLEDNQITEVPSNDWKAMPLLRLGKLQCLNGCHRIQAAKRYVAPNDRWWIARLFMNHLPESEQVRLAEDYSNQRSHTDGEIFHKIRSYHRVKDHEAENKWWARLTETKRKDLRQLLKDVRYAEAFDSMLLWPGLWTTVKLGSLHRLLCLKCDEEVLRYLRHVSVVWHTIMPDAIEPSSLDTATVERLQTLTPSYSTEDNDIIRELFESNVVFPQVTSNADRTILKANVLSVHGMIPSFFTFFEDIKYLEPCAKVMRSLCDCRSSGTIHNSLMRSFFDPPKRQIEYARLDLRPCPPVSSPVFEKLAELQLWLFAFRNFPQLSNDTPRKSPAKSKPVASEPDPALWQAFAEMAQALGFVTNEVMTRLGQDKTDKARSPFSQRHGIGLRIDTIPAGQLCRHIKSCGSRTIHPSSTMFTASPALKILQRCGRPFEEDHEDDREKMYLPQMFERPSTAGPNITPFYRKWNIIRIFFDLDHIPDIDFTVVQEVHTPITDVVPSIEPLDCQNEVSIVFGELSREQTKNAELTAELVALRTKITRQLAEHGDLQREVAIMKAREQTVEGQAGALTAAIADLKGSQALETESRSEIARLELALVEAQNHADASNLALDEQNERYESLNQSFVESVAQCARHSEAELSMLARCDEATLQVTRLEAHLEAQRSEHQDKLRHWDIHAGQLQSREDEISRLRKDLSQRAKSLEGVNIALQDSQMELSKLKTTVVTLEQSEEAFKLMSTELKQELLLSKAHNSTLQTDLAAAGREAQSLEMKLQATEENLVDQENKTYQAEVRTQNDQQSHDNNMTVMHDELTKLRSIIHHSASDADLVLSGEKLSSGPYLTLHTAHRATYGVETWVRYFAERYAYEAVEVLELCSAAHCEQFNLAFPPDFFTITDGMTQGPQRLAESWESKGELWRWSKSIDEPMRTFMEGYKRSRAPRGVKRKGQQFLAESKKLHSGVSGRQEGSSAPRRTQNQLEGQSVQLAIEWSNPDASPQSSHV